MYDVRDPTQPALVAFRKVHPPKAVGPKTPADAKDMALALASDGRAYAASERAQSLWTTKTETCIATYDVTDPARWTPEAPPKGGCALM